MLYWITNAIPIFFYLLLFFVPLVLFPKTSELFEFNKMVLTYGLTILIITLWLTKIILVKKKIFKRTLLDIPLLIFLGFQTLSTLTSIDFRTSLLGYYSRYHGGLMSSISYVLLYWAFVSNMDRKKTIKAIRVLVASAFLVSVYGVLEHFGIDKDIWVQDVQNRVFSTLGQPNWLAAWLVALIPITWAFALESRKKSKLFWLWIFLSSFFFLTLLYTKSRSGLIGFIIADAIFWVGAVWISFKNQKLLKKSVVKTLVICNLSFVILALAIGTPWTPNIQKLFTKQATPITDHQPPTSNVPAIELGGTASSEIRKIVWQGAVDIWKNYPILGTGPETFGFAYYNFRPVEHNLVSEWDFLYNKAHNEYLNIAATTGTAGLIAYLTLALTVGIIFVKSFQSPVSNLQLNPDLKNRKFKNSLENGNLKMEILALSAGWTSILVTNFFGFSVVPVGLAFFLFPAIAVVLTMKEKEQDVVDKKENILLSAEQIVIILILSLVACYLLFITSRYWYADYSYSMGKVYNDQNEPIPAQQHLKKATSLSSNEAVFWAEFAKSSTNIALALNDSEETQQSEKFMRLAISQSEKAVSLSPSNVNLKRSQASLFVKLSIIEPSYLINAKNTLVEAVKLAPTDAKLFYNLALTCARTGEGDKAIELLAKTVEMKENYRNARFALALLLIDAGETDKAKEQLEYILEKISPEDKLVKKELEKLVK